MRASPASGGSAGVGFSVPVDTVNRVVPQIIETGRYAPLGLGIETDDMLSSAIARQLGVQGVAVSRAPPRSPGALAGLRGVRLGPRDSIIPGDIIIAVDKKEVSQPRRKKQLLREVRVDESLVFSLLRRG